MGKPIPFDDDVMMLIMGIEPEKPGQHGRVMAPDPGDDAIAVICKIRDLCEDFLRRAGKDGGNCPAEGEPDSDMKDAKEKKDEEDHENGQEEE